MGRKVCSKCGYTKSGYSKDRILMCLDCGTVWPKSDKKKKLWVEPPKGVTSTDYHNRACDVIFERKKIVKQIKELQQKADSMQFTIDCFLEAKKHCEHFNK